MIVVSMPSEESLHLKLYDTAGEWVGSVAEFVNVITDCWYTPLVAASEVTGFAEVVIVTDTGAP